MRIEHSSDVRIAAPREQVWQLVTDWERQGEWIPLTRVWRTGGTPGASTSSTVIVSSNASGPTPVRCLVEHTGRVVRGLGEFRLSESAGCTHLVWVEQVDVPGGRFAPLLWRVASPLVRLAFGFTLRRLARRAEKA
jgi:carbon monoxide dehydrogenase subunit G